MAAKKPTTWVKGLGSLVMFGLLSGLLWPRAAVDVQAVGDGAEMAMAAVLGSLVHPPGFPILGHINQFLFHTFEGQAYAILAKASVVEHALAGAFILWILTTWLRNLRLAFALVLVVFLSPAAMRVASDAEVFALHHLFVALVLWGAMTLYRHKPSVLGYAVLGFLFGLAGAHHPMAVFWLPLVFLPLAKDKTKAPQMLGAAFLAALLGLLPYVSLFSFYEASPLLAFGQVTSFSELFHHVMRTTYGTLKLSGNYAQPTSLVLPFFREAFVAAPALLALWAYGLIRGYEEKNASRLVFSFIFVAHLVFLLLAQMPNTPASLELGSRFYGAVFLALLAGALPGCFYFLKDKEKQALYLLVAALILPAAINFKSAYSEVNWHDNQVTREWLDATFDHLPENAVFIAQHDAEAFGALHDQAVNGKRKDIFVVVEGRLPTTWYRTQLAQTLPFLHGQVLAKDAALLNIITRALDAEHRVLMSFPTSLGMGLTLRPMGVGWEVFRNPVPANEVVIQSLLNTCATMTQSFKISGHISPSTEALLENWAASYVALSQTLAAMKQDTDSLKAGIAKLKEGQGFQALKNACNALIRNRDRPLKKSEGSPPLAAPKASEAAADPQD